MAPIGHDQMARPDFAIRGARRLIIDRAHRALDLVIRHHPLFVATVRIGHGHCRDEFLRIGVLRIFEDRGPWADLDDLAEIHHRYAMADALDDRNVVRDEQEGEVEALLQVQHQVDDCALIETSSAETLSEDP
jgi:hypothetical protein